MNTQDPKYKHKPSEKHTLEEVLKSLQDMIRNDLRETEHNAAPADKSHPASAATGETPRHEPTPPVREDFAPTNPAAGPVNLDAVVRSLKDLISNELSVAEPAVAEKSTLAPSDQNIAGADLNPQNPPSPEEAGESESSEINHDTASHPSPRPLSEWRDDEIDASENALEEPALTEKPPAAVVPEILSIDEEPIQPDAPSPPSPTQDAVEEIVAEALLPPEEAPVYEESDELGVDMENIVDEDFVSPNMPSTTTPAQPVTEKNPTEELTPLEDEPIFEAPDEPTMVDEPAPRSVIEAPAELEISNELMPSMGATSDRDIEAEIDRADLESPDESSIVEEPLDLGFDRELAPTDDPSPAPLHGDAGVSTEFEALDETLTFEESAEIVAPVLTEPVTPEFPGEINPELLDAPAEAVLPAPTAPEPEKKSAPGVQQEFSLDELPSDVIEPVISARNLAPETEAPPVAGEILGAASAHVSADAPAETLPTIDVEENFDDVAYPAVSATQEAAASTGHQELQMISPSALVPVTAPEPLHPPAATPSADDEAALAPKPVETPELVSITVPVINKIKLEVVDGPLMPSAPSAAPVDFEAIALTPLDAPPDAVPPAAFATEPALTVEHPASVVTPETITQEPRQADQAPPSVNLETRAPEHTPPSLTKAPTSSGNPRPKKEKIPTVKDETQKTATPPEPQAKPRGKPTTVVIDDIPVLNEVVLPPTSTSPVSDTAPIPSAQPLPTPDRTREVVVRAVARLNVEMRQSGGAGLDSKTILRLQKLIREELEKIGGM